MQGRNFSAYARKKLESNTATTARVMVLLSAPLFGSGAFLSFEDAGAGADFFSLGAEQIASLAALASANMPSKSETFHTFPLNGCW